MKNTTNRSIDGVKVAWSLQDNFGESVKEAYDGGMSQNDLKANGTATYSFELYRTLARKVTVYVTDVHFKDGDKLTVH